MAKLNMKVLLLTLLSLGNVYAFPSAKNKPRTCGQILAPTEISRIFSWYPDRMGIDSKEVTAWQNATGMFATFGRPLS
jgi:hypothetical protein